MNETFPALDPVDGSLWLSRYEGGFDDQTILVAARNADAWDAPVIAPFSGEFGDRAPRLSPDGGRLYFTSNRPRAPGGEGGDMNIWVVERSATGWSEPTLVPSPVSSEARAMHVSVARNAIYFASARDGGFGRSDIYRVAVLADGWGPAEHLPAPVNDELNQPDILIEPDEQWMILVVTDHPAGLGGDDLFLVRRDANRWSAPEHLPAPVNSEEYEYGPTLSPDGRYLYFTSHRGGNADVYRIALRVLGIPAGAANSR